FWAAPTDRRILFAFQQVVYGLLGCRADLRCLPEPSGRFGFKRCLLPQRLDQWSASGRLVPRGILAECARSPRRRRDAHRVAGYDNDSALASITLDTRLVDADLQDRNLLALVHTHRNCG